MTERIKMDAIRLAETTGRPPLYLASSAVFKDAAVLAKAKRPVRTVD